MTTAGAVAVELFGLPLEQFTAARDARAKARRYLQLSPPRSRVCRTPGGIFLNPFTVLAVKPRRFPVPLP